MSEVGGVQVDQALGPAAALRSAAVDVDRLLWTRVTNQKGPPAFAPQLLEAIGCEVLPLDCELDYAFPPY